MTLLSLDGFSLTAEQVVNAARDANIKVVLAESARTTLLESRAFIE